MFVQAMRCARRSLYTGPYNFVSGQLTDVKKRCGEFSVLQPASGKTLCVIPSCGLQDVDLAVNCAKNAYPKWSCLSPRERGKHLLAVAKKIREDHKEIAQVETDDTGKPISEAVVDVLGCADVLEYYGGIAASIKGEHFDLPGGSFAIVRREPLGVVVGIGAWNYPFQVMSWKLAPALACGNTFVFKPSPLTPLSALLLARICADVGVPSGVINVVQGESETGQHLCQHPEVAKVTFTGSVATGQKIMKMCTDSMKRVTLELGGKSPLLVFQDADIVESVKAAMLGNFFTQGEVCSNCTRVYVQRPLVTEFVDHLAEATCKLKVGDPTDPETNIGATISTEHASNVLRYIADAKKEGASVVCGGVKVTPEDPSLCDGNYLSPCILTDCKESMKVVQEEVFGAVLAVMPFDTEEEAIHRANASPYGLAAGVMTKDLQRAHRVASRLQAGIVWINNYNIFPPEVPFGGYKMSGFGRENGLDALQCFSQGKTIYVEMASPIQCPLYKM
ncbi:4-trimethylaminobutyraldehyde dehydrogenase A-like [Ornithodoros turicata]|uniref:4-trimethylaminobutyraldehyde dehydrogenase A-like n=1 Tax=Ornithodoros turicata TaxID=34597 RepID=UPI003139B899